jgi:hypothetical protein
MKPDQFSGIFGDRRGSPTDPHLGEADASTSPAKSVVEQRPAQNPLRVPAWIPRATYVFVLIATVTLLVLHTVKAAGVQVDTTTLGLLALLLLVPLAPYIRRIRAAGFEAEISRHEAQQLQASAADLPVTPVLAIEPSSDAPTIQELVVRDPPLGLAKLRIELERELREFYANRFPDPAIRRLSLGTMSRDLRARGVLPPEIAAPLEDVTALANRAVHGEYVPAEVAQEIVNVGLRVLSALRAMRDSEPAPSLENRAE